MGHAEAWALADVIARWWFQQGYDVLHPVGWDSFGLPAENAAIKRGVNPATWTDANIETQAESFRRYAISFDWSTRLATHDPAYYKWTQWLFLKLYEHDLAYRKDSPVNWCPNDQTVLANEQVVGGHCERCGAEVTKRNLTQWYFRITQFNQRLLDDMAALEGKWPDRILAMQRNWIGRSEGAHVDFVIEGPGGRRDEPVTVFTTRPDTLFGATFFVVAADAALAAELVTDDQRDAFETYLSEVRRSTEVERMSEGRDKTGVFLGVHAVNPVNGERIPVYAADYVLADYGTGAIMAVPGQDQRDWDFATKFGLPIVRTVQPAEGFEGEAYTGEGPAINSANDEISLDGLDVVDAKATIITWLESKGTGRGTINFRLRDWLISRQRYWGPPIPIIHCPVDGEVPVPVDQLPVTLPEMQDVDMRPKGVSPLASATDWVEVTCPRCGGPAKRDTDTMDTFVDSSWYFLRYPTPNDDSQPFDVDAVRRWGAGRPVRRRGRARDPAPAVRALRHQGAARHGLPGLRRAVHRADEPGRGHQRGQGHVEVAGQRRRPGRADREVRRRRGPADDGVRRSARGRQGLGGPVTGRVAALPAAGLAAVGRRDERARHRPDGGDAGLRKVTHKVIHDATQLLGINRFNVVVARVMELVNATRKAIDSGAGAADPAVREATETVAIVLSLVAPYTAEEMWERLGHQPSVAKAGWPVADEALLVEDTVTCVVQVQGKVRARLEVAPDIAESELEAMARADEHVVRAIGDAEVRKVIVRAPKLVNVVTG